MVEDQEQGQDGRQASPGRDRKALFTAEPGKAGRVSLEAFAEGPPAGPEVRPGPQGERPVKAPGTGSATPRR